MLSCYLFFYIEHQNICINTYIAFYAHVSRVYRKPDNFNNMDNTPSRQYVTVPEILQELLRMKRTDTGYNAKSREIGQYLNSLEGKWKNIGCKKNRIYGTQKAWKRVVTETTFSVTIFGYQRFTGLESL